MKSSLMFIVTVCIMIVAGVALFIYFEHRSITNVEQSRAVDSKLSPGVKFTPGTIYGFVMDKNKNGIPGATVTTYSVNVIDGYPLSDGLVDIANNPQTTASDDYTGFFAFEDLQPGYYNITAEKDGHMWFAIVNVTGMDFDGIEHGVVIPDYMKPVQ
jgi:hypothetical protein